MKEIWVRVWPWDKEAVINALESGADGVVIPPGKSAEVKQLGVLKTIAEDGDLKLGQDVFEVDIRTPEDQDKVIEMDPGKPVIIRASDWSIIPLENILARRRNIMAEVQDLDQARLFLGVLERGVDGVVVATDDFEETARIIREVKGLTGSEIELITAVVRSVQPLGMGDRVCADTCSLLALGQGLLVGNSSQALFLVHAENVDNPYVSQRPFRVNAGAVHAYVLVPGGRTRYLSELEAGDEVLAVNSRGQAEIAVIGRVKIEKRPLLLVTAEAQGRTLTTILQNAETIRLTTPEGAPISVVNLEPGREILVALEEGGRHFGHKVEETILEH
ncbi:MAG: 3-dehydroquinate synthase II [Deltaproteobacteria bacterium]|nr:3-dehydroquinate synthase II [Deltaproteobacteria bacterium]MBW2084578.1 3-dehydroquinate synthase II [Deltaproteobacteria bacterium]